MESALKEFEMILNQAMDLIDRQAETIRKFKGQKDDAMAETSVVQGKLIEFNQKLEEQIKSVAASRK